MPAENTQEERQGMASGTGKKQWEEQVHCFNIPVEFCEVKDGADTAEGLKGAAVHPDVVNKHSSYLLCSSYLL